METQKCPETCKKQAVSVCLSSSYSSPLEDTASGDPDKLLFAEQTMIWPVLMLRGWVSFMFQKKYCSEWLL